MHGLLLSLWLGASPPVASSDSTPTTPAQPELPERRLSKGQRVLIGSGAAYAVGAAVQWATAGGTGMLGDATPGATSAVTLGMNLGGFCMLGSLLTAGFGGRDLGQARGEPDHRAKPLIAGGAVVTSIGAGTMVVTTMLWPTIRAKCPIGAGCGLVGMQLGGAATSVGVGLLSYGATSRQRDPGYRALSKTARTPLIAGGVLLGTSYVLTSTWGMALWQDQPTDALARRTRNRLLIPVVGPWIHAAGPDAPLFVAMVAGGLGALQIGGAVALAVGAGIAGSERSRWRRRGRVQVTVVPSLDGISVAGRF